MNYNDSNTHVIKTSAQWNERAIEYWVVPRGCLCVELTPKGKTKIKIGEGNKNYYQLPYIGSSEELYNYYTKEEVDALLNNFNRMAIMSTDEYPSKDDLPTHGNKVGDVRFVAPSSPDIKPDPDLYVWDGRRWIYTGSPLVDMSEYVKTAEFNIVKNKVDEIFPMAHTHANKAVLDNITQEKLDEIDELAEMYDGVKTDITDLKSKSHTHQNKQVLDIITDASLWSSIDREKFNSLHNYDDTEVKDRLTVVESKAHTHDNKSVLDGITQEKLDEITELAATYIIVKQDITELKEKEHSHDNIDILNETDASYTIAQQNELNRLSNIGPFLGCGPTWNGIFGYVPAPEAGCQNYFLRGDGTWALVKATGDKYKAGEGIYILSGEVTADTFPFKLYAKGGYVKQYVIYGAPGGVGDYNSTTKKYHIPVRVSADGHTSILTTIQLDNPLYEGDWVNYENQTYSVYRTDITSQLVAKSFVTGILTNGTIDNNQSYNWNGNPVISDYFELEEGAIYEIQPANTFGMQVDKSYCTNVNVYDENKNRTRTVLRNWSNKAQIIPQAGEKYIRYAGPDQTNDWTKIYKKGSLYRLKSVVSPVTVPLQQIQLIPNTINTIDILTTHKPLDVYMETVVPPDPDPDDPMSEYTGIIYNDGVLDVTQENPDALNELTFHYRDNVDKTITIPSASVMEGATDQTDGEEGLVPAPLTGDENKFLRGDGTWVEVSGGASYIEGNGIELIGTTEVDMNFDYTAFVNSLTGAYNGTLTKNVDGSITITPSSASGSWTVPDIGGGSPSPYKFNVGSGTTYKLTWDSGDDTVNGSARVFENAAVTTMYIAPQSNHELTFTTSDSCSYISIRFEETDLLPMTISNVKLYRLDASAVSINAKLGDGLSFDSNGAITADSITPQYVRVNTSDSYVLLHTKPSDWDDTWYKYYRLSYDELTTEPPDWDPTRHYKYENDNYVLGSPGDTFVSTTWYDKHYIGLDPNTPIIFDSDVYYTSTLNLIQDGELFDTAFEKVNEAIEHIERLEQNVQFLHDNKVDVRETVDPERIEFYYS